MMQLFLINRTGRPVRGWLIICGVLCRALRTRLRGGEMSAQIDSVPTPCKRSVSTIEKC